ncbi:MAG: hypothetical protein WCJ30_03285 [Deltaproteobacteria bacterium]
MPFARSVLVTLAALVAISRSPPRSAQAQTPRTPPPSTGACAADDIPYFEAGCDGPGVRRCWPGAVHPTPMETCLCNGTTGDAPLPGGGLRWRHAGRCAAPRTPATDAGIAARPAVPGPPTDVPAWLGRCAVASRNGGNPEIDVPGDLVTTGRAALLAAVANDPRDRRRCAVWALSRNAPARELRSFWRAQTASGDAQVRWEAVYSLSQLGDAADLDVVLRQYAEAPVLRPALASWLRRWHDRRVIPCVLALFAQSEAATTRANALTTMQLLALTPTHPSDAADHEIGAFPSFEASVEASTAPYLRWWRSTGRTEFRSEDDAWHQLIANLQPARLEPDWIEMARAH